MFKILRNPKTFVYLTKTYKMNDLTKMSTDEIRETLRNSRRLKKITLQSAGDKVSVSRFVICNTEKNIAGVSMKKFIDYIRAIDGQLVFMEKNPADPYFLFTEIKRVFEAIEDRKITNIHGQKKIKLMIRKFEKGISTKTDVLIKNGRRASKNF